MYTEGANIIDVPTNYVPFDCSGVSFQLPDGCEHAVAVRPFAKRVFFFSFRTGNNGHREVLIWPLGGGSCQLGCMHACDVYVDMVAVHLFRSAAGQARTHHPPATLTTESGSSARDTPPSCECDVRVTP